MSEKVLVTADWLESRLDEFGRDDPAYRLVEVNNTEVTDESEHTPYSVGHAPGATFFDWTENFTDDMRRNIVDKEGFARFNAEAGITEESTVVIYGNGMVPNWYGAYAYWTYKYYGHDEVRLLDGGKQYWVENDYPLTTELPEFTPREYDASGPVEEVRAYREDVETAMEEGYPLLDGRYPEEFRGEVIAPDELEPTAQQPGRIPGATNVPMPKVHNEDGTYRDPDELRDLYVQEGIDGEEPTTTYCRLGERSSIEWFLLHELLGFEEVRNYDGSWTEWGNMVDVPIERGEADD